MRIRTLLGICILIGFISSSCQTQELDAVGETYLDATELNYTYFGNSTDPVNQYIDSLNARATLGRVLFYDRQMSLNNSVACASCHKQSKAFSDDRRFSKGFESRSTARNSMPLQNLGFSGVSNFDFMVRNSSSIPNNGGTVHFFWDGREQSLNNLILQPVGDHIEMGITDIDALADKLAALPYYKALFVKAFGSKKITADRISNSVTTFISTINSFNTAFDRHNGMGIRSDASITEPQREPLPPLELEGMMLFQDKYDCNSCHQVQNPTGYIQAGTFANIGLDATYTDQGLAKVTGNTSDVGKFKIPSLRNVAHTAPYMHDGRFASLDDVVEHYSEGMADHPNIDDRLTDAGGHAKSMNISAHEKEAIIAFLRALSDESVLTDPKFSNPFRVK